MILELILFEWLICKLEIGDIKLKKYFAFSLIMLMQLGEIIVIFIRPAQSIWYTILELPSALIATGILFKEKMWRKLAVFLFAYGYIDVIEYPIKIIVGSNNDLMVYIITIIIICLIGKIINQLTMISFVMLGIFGIVFMFLGAYKKQLEIDNKIKQNYLIIQKEHYSQLYSHMREIRKIKHDMNAHINILYNLLDTEQYDEAVKYIYDIKMHYDIGKKLESYYDNGIIDAIIYYFNQKNPLIKFICMGNFSGRNEISDLTICTILSNCISNAVEACNRLQKKKKEIMINISNVKNYMVIMIENPIEWEVDISKLGRYTSKDDRLSHGYGVSNIIDEVRLCEGNYNFCADDGKFSVSIAIKK